MPAPHADPGPIHSQFAGDSEMSDLLDLFVAELGPRSEQFAALLAARRLDELRVLAHQLKGAAGGYGYPILSVAAGVLEKHLVGPDRDLDEVRRAVADLQGICDRAIRGHQPGL